MSFAQIIDKPIGCFAGTNGTHPSVLTHEEVRGVLLIEKWSDIEVKPDEYDFSLLNQKIDAVKAKGLKYALAIAGGAFGSPNWLIDSLNVEYHNFQYQGQNWRLPLWWDPTCAEKLTSLIAQLGNQYSSDSLLSHIYVTQMTVNGIEGHLNGVNMVNFTTDGFTNQKWMDQARNTAMAFAHAFPYKPIVFEVHEIDRDTLLPAAIINNLYNNESLCNRLGLGMWWISGKTSYQPALLEFIKNFPGDKYAQVIGRSNQEERFQNSDYGSVFIQAKQLGIRYIEPWPYEFQHRTHDSLMQDFNSWADSAFTPSDTCSVLSTNEDNLPVKVGVNLYPNPSKGLLKVDISQPYQDLQISIYNLNGQQVSKTYNQTEWNISHLNNGTYILIINIDNHLIPKKLVKLE
ncbi:hypothetical protein GCM10025777_05720 [Membranihabitans marinus]